MREFVRTFTVNSDMPGRVLSKRRRYLDFSHPRHSADVAFGREFDVSI